MDLKDLKIGVLGGGISGEREISLISSECVCKALSSLSLSFSFIDITTTDQHSLSKQLISAGIDLAFIALHGEFGEDGKIQNILEDLGLIYNGSGVNASRLAMDKILTKKIFFDNGIETPDFRICSDKRFLPGDLSLPIVIKPSNSGSSLGVSVVEQESFLPLAAEKAFEFSEKIILEEYIPGRELTVGILNEEPLGVVEILPKTGYYDFAAKYSDGQCDFIAPAALDPGTYRRCQQLSLSAHKVLGCRDFSRVDLRLASDNTPFVLEVNSIPGLTSHSLLPLTAKVMGLSFPDLVLKMIIPAYQRFTHQIIEKNIKI
ncbi:MAG: D-alanine--D-alanine ligase [Candidatus Omnitrophica bacterium]|nr:D-alanine--D-alanine ligase [Candidatus Omnitrophota bacterium]